MTLFTVGPVCNIQDVLRKDPGALKLAKRVVSMFGSFYMGYDAGPRPAAREHCAGRLQIEVGLGFRAAVTRQAILPQDGQDFFLKVDVARVLDFSFGDADRISKLVPEGPNVSLAASLAEVKARFENLALNAVEEWTIVNFNNIRHPFHIHVNPMYVVAVNGKRLAEPYWADTVPLPYNDNTPPPGTNAPATVTSITFRMRFLHYTGRYVMHCHMLVHEDMGMMQGVTVV